MRAKRAKYGALHQRERARWANTLRAIGRLTCVRCALPIIADTATNGPLPHVARCERTNCGGECWHAMELDHDDADPTGRTYLGPAHEVCNRSAGGRKAHGRPPRPTATPGATPLGNPYPTGAHPQGPPPGGDHPLEGRGPTTVRAW